MLFFFVLASNLPFLQFAKATVGIFAKKSIAEIAYKQSFFEKRTIPTQNNHTTPAAKDWLPALAALA